MTREEAILWLQVLKHSKVNWVGEQAEDEDIIARCEEAEQEAFDVAIEALKRKPILCSHCKHYILHDHRCGWWNHGVSNVDWCSYAERREP